MKILRNPKLIEQAKKELNIDALFSNDGLSFFIAAFEKGEYIASPLINRHSIFFILNGSVDIYTMNENSELLPVWVLGKGDMIGEVEYASGQDSATYAEVYRKTECLAINYLENEALLKNDVKFLKMLLASLAKKVYSGSILDTPSVKLEDKLLFYLKNHCENNAITNINTAVMQLRCSRRQLHRVLNKLVSEGSVKKEGKGSYKLLS